MVTAGVPLKRKILDDEFYKVMEGKFYQNNWVNFEVNFWVTILQVVRWTKITADQFFDKKERLHILVFVDF